VHWVSLIARLENGLENGLDYGMDYEILCKAEGTILHCVLASFVLFYSVRPQKNL